MRVVGAVKEVSLGDDCGDVAVRANGVRVEFHANGSVDLYTDRPVALHTPVNGNGERSSGKPRKIGETMPDGTIYAGISPDTGKPMYATPNDAPLTYTFQEATEYAAAQKLRFAYEHQDWRVPTKRELSVLFKSRAAIGGFNKTGSYPVGWYWSSTEDRGNVACAWQQRFSDGHRGWYHKSNESSLRLVRS